MKKTTSSTLVAKPASTAATYPRTFTAVQRQRAQDNGPSPASHEPAKANGNGESALDAEAILAALRALKKGDFSTRLPVGWTGIAGKVADTFNEVAELMSYHTEE